MLVAEGLHERVELGDGLFALHSGFLDLVGEEFELGQRRPLVECACGAC